MKGKNNLYQKMVVVGPYAFLLVLSLIFCLLPPLWGKDLHGDDVYKQWYEWRFQVTKGLERGYFPYWTPEVYCGSPLLPNFNVQAFYPLSLPYLFLPLMKAFFLEDVLHLFLASLFMFVFMRELGMDRFSSTLSGVVFAYGGFFVARLSAGHLSALSVGCWLPLMALFGERTIKAENWQKSFFYALWAGATGGICLLAGVPHISYFCFLALSAYFVLRTATLRRFRAVAWLLVIYLMAFLLASIQMLPSFELAWRSTRASGIPFHEAAEGSMPPTSLLTLIFPDFFGHVADGYYWNLGNLAEFYQNIYFGILPLFFALSALWSKEKKLPIIFFSMAVFCLLFTLGKWSPVFWLSYHFLPGVNMFRVPGKIIIIYIFSVSALVGLGSGLIMREGESQRLQRAMAWFARGGLFFSPFSPCSLLPSPGRGSVFFPSKRPW